MIPVCFRTPATLLRLSQGYGRAGETVTARRDIRCDVREPTQHFKLTAGAAGKSVDLRILLYKRDFDKDDWTHIEVGGVRYRIDDKGAPPGGNMMLVEIVVKRN